MKDVKPTDHHSSKVNGSCCANPRHHQAEQSEPADGPGIAAEPDQAVTPLVQPAKKLAGLGYFLLFILAIVFLTGGVAAVQAMVNEAKTTEAESAEAARPADIRISALTAEGCDRCYNVQNLISGITQSQQAKIIDSRTIVSTSAEGAALVKQYNLTRVPALILEGEAAKLIASLPQLKSFGQLKGDAFVGLNLPTPYVEIATGKQRGDFNAVYVTEKQCSECYDPTDNRKALAQLGLVPKEEKTVDRSDPEGQKLVKQYSLTTTPTVILTGDLAAYVGFDKVWANVGTKEADGAYVFRQGQGLMGTYYDLKTKQAVAPQKSSNTNNSNQ